MGHASFWSRAIISECESPVFLLLPISSIGLNNLSGFNRLFLFVDTVETRKKKLDFS